jgi:anti-anti-sigma regulatory factor
MTETATFQAELSRTTSQGPNAPTPPPPHRPPDVDDPGGPTEAPEPPAVEPQEDPRRDPGVPRPYPDDAPESLRRRPLEHAAIEIDTSIAGRTSLSLVGHHDLLTSGELELAIADALRRGDSLVVDLAGTSFVDSSILQKLLSGRDVALAARREFVVEPGTSSRVLRALELAGLLPRPR